MLQSTKSFKLILLAGVLVMNVFVILLLANTLIQAKDQREREVRMTIENMALLLDQNVSGLSQKIGLSLREIADAVERELRFRGSLDPATINALLEDRRTWLSRSADFRVTDAAGAVKYGPGVVPGSYASYADRNFFGAHSRSPDMGLLLTNPVVGRVSGIAVVVFSRRYNFPDGSFAGVVVAAVPISHLTQLISGLELGAGGVVALRDADNALITRQPVVAGEAGRTGSKVFSREFGDVVASGVTAKTYYSRQAGEGVERIVAYRRLAAVPYHLVVGMGAEQYLAEWRSQVRQTVAMAAAFLVVTLISAWLLWRFYSATEKASQRSRLLLQHASDGIHILDSRGVVIEASDSFCQMLGYLPAETIGMNMHQWDTNLSPGEVDQLVAQHLERRDISIYETRHRRKDGSTFDVEVSGIPLELDGKPVLFNSARDITARKRSEAELELHRHHLEELVQQRSLALLETEARATHLLQSSADGLYGVDQAGRVTFINPAGCQLLGYTPAETIGRSAHALFHHSKPDGSPYPIEACPSHDAVLTGHEIRVDNEVYWHADGHPVPVMYAVHPMIQNGVSSGAVISFVDMSAQRAAAQAREQALLAAENLASVRSAFLANMSHEIRTPLNGVLGFAEIGQRNYQNSERARESFAKILTSGKRLLGVINDILDFSKIEAGKLNIEQTEVLLGEVVEHALELVRDRADAKHLDLSLELAADLPPSCSSDPLRMGQVLLNVLSNAVKFTEQGSVRLAVSRQGEQLLFTVADSGIGMSPQQMKDLFNPFHQADASSTRRFGGTGLGLAISKRILELMGGEIAVHSQPGSGTRVEFRLPYVPVAQVPTPATPAAVPGRQEDKPLAGISFLVAEDEPVNQAVLEENLLEDGARVTMVGNGREAVECIRRNGAASYDIVLMDIQMPEMDGYEATRQIRELAPGLPIIAQTAHAFSEEREKCLAAGMAGHVAKPIDSAALVALVRQFVPAKSQG